MRYEPFLATSSFFSTPMVAHPYLSTRHYHQAIWQIYLALHPFIQPNYAAELEQELSSYRCQELALFDWKNDKILYGLATENIYNAFADIDFLEHALYKLTYEFINIKNPAFLLSAREALYRESLYGLIKDLQHIHCKFPLLMVANPAIPLWAKASNKITVEKAAHASFSFNKSYVYQPLS